MYILANAAGSSEYTDDCHAFRFSSGRFHTATEAREDFIAVSSAPTIDYETRREPLIVDLASGLAEVDGLVGPVQAMAAADAQQNDLVLTSPVANVVFNTPAYELNDGTTNPQRLTLPPGETDTDWHMIGSTLLLRTVPRTINRLRIRAHIETQSGATGTTDVRVYTMTRPPNAGDSVIAQAPVMEWYHTTTETINDEAASHDGDWYDLGDTAIARDPQGKTWIALAFKSSLANGAGYIRVRALTVDPALDLSGGNFGGGFGG
jgi:hypothetical protein